MEYKIKTAFKNISFFCSFLVQLVLPVVSTLFGAGQFLWETCVKRVIYKYMTGVQWGYYDTFVWSWMSS